MPTSWLIASARAYVGICQVLRARLPASLTATSEAPVPSASVRADELAVAGLLPCRDRLMATVPAWRSLTSGGYPPVPPCAGLRNRPRTGAGPVRGQACLGPLSDQCISTCGGTVAAADQCAHGAKGRVNAAVESIQQSN
jgi:hypothetical protein